MSNFVPSPLDDTAEKKLALLSDPGGWSRHFLPMYGFVVGAIMGPPALLIGASMVVSVPPGLLFGLGVLGVIGGIFITAAVWTALEAKGYAAIEREILGAGGVMIYDPLLRSTVQELRDRIMGLPVGYRGDCEEPWADLVELLSNEFVDTEPFQVAISEQIAELSKFVAAVESQQAELAQLELEEIERAKRDSVEFDTALGLAELERLEQSERERIAADVLAARGFESKERLARLTNVVESVRPRELE